ncbi:MAG: hypothetical protein JXQ87_13405 [Bacteroidia bacterium]
MKRIVFILLVFCGFSKSYAQFDLETQMGEIGKAIPSYYYAYTKNIFSNVGQPIIMGNQIQHWKKDWKIKYGLSFSGQFLNNDTWGTGGIEFTELYQSPNISYLGNLSDAFGSEEASFIRHYLLDNNGNKIVNPLTGEYLSTDIEMAGGLGRGLTTIPYVLPSIELKIWKGISIAGSYLPVSWFLREFEEDNFKTSVNMYSIGAGLTLREFTDIPVLSWLRFDASMSGVNASFSELQDALDLEPTEFFNLDLTQFELGTSIRTNQFRGTLAIPVMPKKNIILLAQAGYYTHTYSFNFDYNIDVEVDAEQLKEDYNIEFEGQEFSIGDTYSQSEQIDNTFYYSGGLLIDSQISTFYLGYAQFRYPTLCLRASIKLL